jgi:hypothetical protein
VRLCYWISESLTKLIYELCESSEIIGKGLAWAFTTWALSALYYCRVSLSLCRALSLSATAKNVTCTSVPGRGGAWVGQEICGKLWSWGGGEMIEGLTPGQTQTLTRINVGASALSFAGSFFIALCYVFFKDLRSFPFKLVFYLSLSVSVFGFTLSLFPLPPSLPPLPHRSGNIWKLWIDLEVFVGVVYLISFAGRSSELLLCIGFAIRVFRS